MIYKPLLHSLETNWLSKKDRHLPAPDIFYVNNLDIGGLYIPPRDIVMFEHEIEIHPSNGTIIIGEYNEDFPLEAIMAHEWRHHWQYWNGWEYDGIGWNFTEDYDVYIEQITKYFLHSFSETDALKYELKHFTCKNFCKND